MSFVTTSIDTRKEEICNFLQFIYDIIKIEKQATENTNNDTRTAILTAVKMLMKDLCATYEK